MKPCSGGVWLQWKGCIQIIFVTLFSLSLILFWSKAEPRTSSVVVCARARWLSGYHINILYKHQQQMRGSSCYLVRSFARPSFIPCMFPSTSRGSSVAFVFPINNPLPSSLIS